MTTKTASDGTVRKDYYGDDEQPWDTMLDEGWAPYFAAGNVLKYLRRTKPGDEAHGIESAKWYYTRLEAMADRDPRAGLVYDRLNKLLSDKEKQKLI